MANHEGNGFSKSYAEGNGQSSRPKAILLFGGTNKNSPPGGRGATGKPQNCKVVGFGGPGREDDLVRIDTERDCNIPGSVLDSFVGPPPLDMINGVGISESLGEKWLHFC